jgi:cytochrome c5
MEASLIAAVEAGQTLSLQAWVDLGRRAFREYPIQPAGYWMNALGDRATATRFGAYVVDDRVGSFVWTEMPGAVRRFEPAYTCATCHASPEGAQLVAGRNNADLDVAGVMALGGGAPLGWRPGTLDVTADASDNPVAIADLRPVRLQNRLHHAGTLRNDLIPLAVRIETLIVTSMNETVRPPRVIVAALAAYLWSLASLAQPREAARAARDAKGRALFEQHCARCHHEDGTSGEPVALATLGTDPRVGESVERGTGAYRVPSLAFVGDRRRLLASGAIDDLQHLLDPQRLEPANARHVPGHVYGLELEPADRAVLLSFVRTL